MGYTLCVLQITVACCSPWQSAKFQWLQITAAHEVCATGSRPKQCQQPMMPRTLSSVDSRYFAAKQEQLFRSLKDKATHTNPSSSPNAGHATCMSSLSLLQGHKLFPPLPPIHQCKAHQRPRFQKPQSIPNKAPHARMHAHCARQGCCAASNKCNTT